MGIKCNFVPWQGWYKMESQAYFSLKDLQPFMLTVTFSFEDRSLFIAWGVGSEDFGLKRWNLADPPLNVISLKWFPLITNANFRDPPPPCLALSRQTWVVLLWILSKFLAIPPFWAFCYDLSPLLFPWKSSDLPQNPPTPPPPPPGDK